MEDLAGNDEIFHEEFAKVITNEDILEADDIFDPEEFYNYVNMELALDRHDDGPEFARFKKRLKDKDGITIGIAADNPILDTRMYEVEYADGYKTAMTANPIASELFSQVDQYGQRFVLFNAIIDLRTNGIQTSHLLVVSLLLLFPLDIWIKESPSFICVLSVR